VKGCFDRAAARAFNDVEGVRASIEYCLKTLDGKCRIDLFQAARGDPGIPIEVTVSAIAQYVKAGKVGCIGLSECSASTIRKASAVHPVGAVEVELSLFETSNLTNGVADACKELGIPIIAYSPLSRGFLTGQLRRYQDLDEQDFRRAFPRFQPDVFDDNLLLVKEVEEIAARKGCSVVQVALSWVAAQSQTIGVPVVPIPGASAVSRVEENMKQVKLTEQELRQIDEVLRKMRLKAGVTRPSSLDMNRSRTAVIEIDIRESETDKRSCVNGPIRQQTNEPSI